MPGVLVDSSVVLDLFTNDPIWGERSAQALAEAAAAGELLIDDIVYAEVSVAFPRIEDLDEAIDGALFTLAPIPRAALFLAGKAFLAYRRRGGVRTAPMPDFIIGAHAAVSGLPLLTREPERVTSAYPKLRLILVR